MNTRVGVTDTFESIIRTYYATNNLFVNNNTDEELEYIINMNVPTTEDDFDSSIHPCLYGFMGFLVFSTIFSVLSVIYYYVNPEATANGGTENSLTESRQSLEDTNVETTVTEFAESRISLNEVNTTEAPCTKMNALMPSPYHGTNISMSSSSSSIDTWTRLSSGLLTSTPPSSDAKYSTPSSSAGEPFTPSSDEKPFTPFLPADNATSTSSYSADEGSVTTSFSVNGQSATTTSADGKSKYSCLSDKGGSATPCMFADEEYTTPYLSANEGSATPSVYADKPLTLSTSFDEKPKALMSYSNAKQSLQSTTSHVEILMPPSIPLDSLKVDSTNQDVLRNPYYYECLKLSYETSTQINPFEVAFQKTFNEPSNSKTLIEMKEYKIMSPECAAPEFSLSGGIIASPPTEINWRSPSRREIISWRTPPTFQTRRMAWLTPEPFSEPENVEQFSYSNNRT